MRTRFDLIAAVCLMAVSPAGAHVLLDQGEKAVVGADYKAIFIVPHGCAGSATIRLRVQIPEGVIVTRTEPKAGWTADETKGKYAAEYDYRGAKTVEGVKEVAWSGSKAPDKTREGFLN